MKANYSEMSHRRVDEAYGRLAVCTHYHPQGDTCSNDIRFTSQQELGTLFESFQYIRPGGFPLPEVGIPTLVISNHPNPVDHMAAGLIGIFPERPDGKTLVPREELRPGFRKIIGKLPHFELSQDSGDHSFSGAHGAMRDHVSAGGLLWDKAGVHLDGALKSPRDALRRVPSLTDFARQTRALIVPLRITATTDEAYTLEVESLVPANLEAVRNAIAWMYRF